MSNAHNPQHWSQLDTEEQIRFWQGVEDGHVASFLVSPEKKSTRRRRGEHSTKPKCENPTWFRPEHYKKRHCCKVSDEAAFCLIQRPYISKTLLTRRISPRGSP